VVIVKEKKKKDRREIDEEMINHFGDVIQTAQKDTKLFDELMGKK